MGGPCRDLHPRRDAPVPARQHAAQHRRGHQVNQQSNPGIHIIGHTAAATSKTSSTVLLITPQRDSQASLTKPRR